MMKKLTAISLVSAMSMLLAACGGDSSPLGNNNNNGNGGGAPTEPDASYSCTTPSEDNPWLDRIDLNFSHRGGAIEFPENTLYAYQRSIEIGADVLEMDVYETADGELVVIHDDTVDRTTDGTGSVSGFTLADIQALDAAYWFVPGRGAVTDAEESEYIYRGIATGAKSPPAGFTAADFKVPTLAETLDRFPNALINIELKPDPDSTGSYEAKVAELLIERQRDDDVIVASFIDLPALLFKAQAPCVSTSFPTGQAALYVAASQGPLPMPPLSVHHAFQVPPELGIPVVSQDFVDDAHAAGVAVHVWTINECQEMLDLLELGVDAIMTDRPQLLEQLLSQPENARNCAVLEGFQPEL